MVKVVAGDVDARGLRFAIVAARFNEPWSERLLAGALDALRTHGASARDLLVVRVPGSFELPLAARRLAAAGAHDAVIATGVILRGETPHDRLIAAEAARGLGDVARETGVPVAFGVVTAVTAAQVRARCGGREGNRGADAALAAIEMARLLARLRRGPARRRRR